MLATGAVDRLKRRSRPVNGPLRGGRDSVNAFLQFYFTTLKKPGNLGVLAGPQLGLVGLLQPW
jgi:hypothetical protein